MNIIDLVGHWFTTWVVGWGGIGLVVALAAWALWYFTPAFLSESKHIILQVAIGATVFTLASTYFYTSGYNAGYKVAINQVAAKNKEASDAVKKAIQSVEECNSNGGTWDTVSGVCQR